jgi:hypothetical protein
MSPGGRPVCRVLLLLSLVLMALPAAAQIVEKRDDPMGVSIAYPLVHLVHSRDPAAEGTTGYFRAHDPFLLYQLGRDLLHRQFRREDGVYGRTGELSVPLYAVGPDSGVARFARDHTASCGFCHSTPYREPGGGQTIGSTGPHGRNTSHFYGAGLVEMIGEQVRAQILERYDEDGDGLLGRDELAGPRPVRIRPTPDAPPIDFGDLSPGPDGVPRLNPVFRVWYLNADGRVLPDAYSFADERVASMGLAMQPFGWGRGLRRVGGLRIAQGGEAATIRAFYTDAADVHMGMQADDPTQRGGPHGLGRRSLSGALQYDLSRSLDLGLRRSAAGLSLDDPDGDGYPSELTEGDVDAVEFYMLHSPAPAVRATPESELGRRVLSEIGCTRCHVETWRIEGRDSARGLTGDRRLFALETRSRPRPDGSIEVIGELVRLSRRQPGGEHVPFGGAATVERIYTDFKHWDLGPAFAEPRFDGSVQTLHRTAPLWGVGSTAPYGHAGDFPTLDAVISAHGGAARAERDAYLALPAERRSRLLDYLESLVLYATDEIPADIDGDGTISERFEVAGQDVGTERFDPRFLLREPPRYHFVGETVDHLGHRRRLMWVDNVAEAFGLDLPFRKDSDGDGFPDAVDPAPEHEEAVR